MKQGYIYILASRKNGATYVGVTSNLVKRVYEYKQALVDGHTKKYNIKMLVYYELYDDMSEAIIREKRIKDWKREWKIELIEKNNPEWVDLYDSIV